MANRWEKFDGCSSELLKILDDVSDKVKIKYKNVDDATLADLTKDFEDVSLEKGLADIEGDNSLADILTPEERAKLAKMLKSDTSFTPNEKLILYFLIGETPTFQVIGDVLGISKPGIKKIFDRAVKKIVDLQKLEGKSYIEAMKRELSNKKAAMADGRYDHKGNQRGMERPGWKDSDKNPANQD